MRSLAGSIVGALLPEREREALVRRWGGDPPLASLVLGLLELFFGIHWLYDSALARLRTMADALAGEFLHLAERRTLGPEEALGFTWGGAVLWLAWLLTPTTWLLVSVPLVGLLRFVAFWGTRQAIGEPMVWALVRLTALARRAAAAANERVGFGDAERPDEIETDEAGALLVHTARLRPEWNELVTIEIAERFYRVAGQDDVLRRGGRSYRYRLVEAGEHDVIRRLVRYAPPPTAT